LQIDLTVEADVVEAAVKFCEDVFNLRSWVARRRGETFFR